MQFAIDSAAHQGSNCDLVYRPEEFSFDTEPSAVHAGRSVLLNDLNLGLDSADHVVSVWGMCSSTHWIEAELAFPDALWCSVHVVDVGDLQTGVSVRLNEEDRFPVLFDRTSGVVCIRGSGNVFSRGRFLPGAVMDIGERGEFIALWLKPQSGFEELLRR